jgi:hypothetical protein
MAGALAAAMAAAAPATASAQNSAPGAPLGAARAAIAERTAVDSFLALVPRRSSDRIEADIETAQAAERKATNRRSRTDELRRQTRDSLEVQEKELDRARDAIRVARELDQSSREEALKREARLRERYLDLLGLRVEALGQKIVTAEQQARRARAVAERYEAELRLADERREWNRLHGKAAVVTGADERRAEQEERLQEQLAEYFEALRDEERETEKLAAARQELAARQLRVLERRRHLFDD